MCDLDGSTPRFWEQHQPSELLFYASRDHWAFLCILDRCGDSSTRSGDTKNKTSDHISLGLQHRKCSGRWHTFVRSRLCFPNLAILADIDVVPGFWLVLEQAVPRHLVAFEDRRLGPIHYNFQPYPILLVTNIDGGGKRKVVGVDDNIQSGHYKSFEIAQLPFPKSATLHHDLYLSNAALALLWSVRHCWSRLSSFCAIASSCRLQLAEPFTSSESATSSPSVPTIFRRYSTPAFKLTHSWSKGGSDRVNFGWISSLLFHSSSCSGVNSRPRFFWRNISSRTSSFRNPLVHWILPATPWRKTSW